MQQPVHPALDPSSTLAFIPPGVLTLGQETQAPPVAGEAAQPLGSEGTQSPGAPGGGGQGGAPAPTPFGGQFLFIIMGFFLLMILMQVFGGRKQKKQRQQMLSSLSKHDRVQTMGGLIGTIAEVRDDEIVLKVDEATNTKVRFARTAVQQVLKKAGSRGETSPAQEPEMANA